MLEHADYRLMHHALGIAYDCGVPYRNYFVAGDDHSDMPGLQRLVDAGYMERRTNPLNNGPLMVGPAEYVFVVTEAGRKEALRMWPENKEHPPC